MSGPAPGAMTTAPMTGGNVYQTGANAYNGAVGATSAAMTTPITPRFGNFDTYQAYTGGNLPTASASGYDPTTYDPTMMGQVDSVTAGQFAGTDLAPYLNPYTETVVNQTAADMERARQIQINQQEAAMQAAGAFGGSRHGIADAETNRNFYDRLGATTGALRADGFNTAMGAAFQDIGNRMTTDLANQGVQFGREQFNAGASNTAGQFNANAENQAGQSRAQASAINAQIQAQRNAQIMDAINSSRQFNSAGRSNMSQFNANTFNDAQQRQIDNTMSGAAQLSGLASQGFALGNSVADRQMAEGNMEMQRQQALLDFVREMYAGYTGQGQLDLNSLAGVLGSVPVPQSQTTSKSPGIADFLTLGAGVLGL